MNKNILIKFFKGEASKEEVDAIADWVNKNQQNQQYFASQKEIWMLSSFKPEQGDSINLREIHCKIRERKGIKWRLVYLGTAAILILCFVLDLSFGTLKSTTTDQSDKHVYSSHTDDKDNIIKQTAHQAEHQSAPQKKYTLYTAKGVKASIELPDGSKVWLNSDSRIEYPKEFEGKTREVILEGEAYFEVVKNPHQPMMIKTGKDFSVEVLGTKLSVKSYHNDSAASAILYHGAITLHYIEKDGNNRVEKALDLKPNEICILQNGSSVAKILSEKKVNEMRAWREGELIFDETPMDEVIKMLERWHGTKFIIENDAIYQYTLSASFESESIVQVMEMIKLCIPVHYSVNKNIVKIW